MKSDTTKQPDSKEGLHTQGEWKIGEQKTFTEIPIQTDKMTICEVLVIDIPEEEGQANAELIVKAVNERQALLDALGKAHKQLHFMCDMYCRDKDGYLKDSNKPGAWDAELDIEIETLINNAK